MIRPALLFSGIIGIFLVGLSACGGSAPPDAQVPARPTATTAAAPTTAPVDTEPVLTQPSQVASCVACHSIDGTRLVGPSWKGLFGKEEALEGGTTVIVDDAYLMESIKNPGAKIVEGYPNAMPATIADSLSDSDIGIINEYIKSLK